MLKIKTIKCQCYSNDYNVNRDKTGTITFTCVGDNNEYMLKFNNKYRDDILNFKNWDYSELKELHIEYRRCYGDDFYLRVKAEQLSKLTLLNRLYLEGVYVEDDRLDTRDEDGNYIWNGIITSLPQLMYLTIYDDGGIIDDIDLGNVPNLVTAQFRGMEIRDIIGYDNDNRRSLHFKFQRCTVNRQIMMNMISYAVDCTNNKLDTAFSVSISNDEY